MLAWTSIVLLLDHSVDVNIAVSVWSKQQIDYLLASPKFNRLDDAGRRDFNSLIGIAKVGTDHHKLASVEEGIFLGN